MSYIQLLLKIQNNQAQYYKRTRLGSSIDILRPKKPCPQPGGALGYFLGGYVPPGNPNWHPILKKISPKIDTPF